MVAGQRRFQPSSQQGGSYLNVGLQHLWVVQEHRSFDYSARVLVNGGQFVDLAGDEATDAFLAVAGGLDHGIEWQRDLANDCRPLTSDLTQFRDVIAGQVRTTRARLGLAPVPDHELLPRA